MNSIPASESQSFIGLDSLIACAVKHLASLGYRHGTIGNYQYIWKEFTQFTMENSNEKTFSTDLIFQFLGSCGISDKFEANMTFRQRHIRNVMHALTDFALHGCFQRRSHVVEKTKLSDNMGENLSRYEQFCREQLWSPLGTIRSRKRDIYQVSPLSRLPQHSIGQGNSGIDTFSVCDIMRALEASDPRSFGLLYSVVSTLPSIPYAFFPIL